MGGRLHWIRPGVSAAGSSREAIVMTLGIGVGSSAPAGEERCPSGIAVAVGAVALVAAAIFGAAVTDGRALRLGGLVLVVMVFAAVSGDGRAALAVGALAWPIGNGFLVDRFGELRWHGGLDGWFVGGLLAAVAVGMTIAQIRREVHARARLRPFAEHLREESPEVLPAGAGPRPGMVGSWLAGVSDGPVGHFAEEKGR
jgi:hypothetical protein